MKMQSYVVLRSLRNMSRDIFAGSMPSAAIAAAPTAELARPETHELSIGEVADLARDSTVVSVAPVMPMRLIEPLDIHATLSDEVDDVAWGVTAVGAHRSPFDGSGSVVAVLDTGIDAGHPAFADVELVRRNFTTGSDSDEHGHGTHCAGTIFGRNIGSTRIGVALGVRKALIGKVLGAGGGSSGQIAQAIQWAVDNGADVISMSLGMDFPAYARQLRAAGMPEDAAVSKALEGYRQNVLLFQNLASFVQAQSRPVLLVAAAGNESGRRAGTPYEVSVSPPAVSQGFVSVAALGRGAHGLDVADFSNTGANIAGPGVAIVSAKLGGGLATMSGTSMATPHVAGVAALWAQKLRAGGMMTSLNLLTRSIASGTVAGLRSGIDMTDIGAGLVQAPSA